MKGVCTYFWHFNSVNIFVADCIVPHAISFGICLEKEKWETYALFRMNADYVPECIGTCYILIARYFVIIYNIIIILY